MAVQSILLIPSEKFKEAEAKLGPLVGGARLPYAYREDFIPKLVSRNACSFYEAGEGSGEWVATPGKPRMAGNPEGLILAWEGRYCHMGMDHLDWVQHYSGKVYGAVPGRVRSSNRWEGAGTTPPEMSDELWQCWLHGWEAEALGLGQLVVVEGP